MTENMFGTDIRAAFGVITDLINSAPSRAGDDGLDDPRIFDDMAERHSLSYRPSRTKAELVEIRLLRTRLEEFLREDRSPARLSTINQLLLTAGSVPQLAEHDGEGVHFHYTMDDASYSSKLIALTAIGLARLMIADAVDRLRVCEGPDCDKVFIDVSRNGSRRYCDSQSCGNRLHAARYRARKGTQAQTA